jgi:hypothetical protein
VELVKGVRVKIGFIWHKTAKNDVLLRTRQLTFWFTKRRDISSPVEELSVSQGLCSVELVKGVRVKIGFIWHKTAKNDGLLRTRQLTFWFTKRRDISSPAKRLPLSQKRFCCIDLVSQLVKPVNDNARFRTNSVYLTNFPAAVEALPGSVRYIAPLRRASWLWSAVNER